MLLCHAVRVILTEIDIEMKIRQARGDQVSQLALHHMYCVWCALFNIYTGKIRPNKYSVVRVNKWGELIRSSCTYYMASLSRFKLPGKFSFSSHPFMCFISNTPKSARKWCTFAGLCHGPIRQFSSKEKLSGCRYWHQEVLGLTFSLGV